MKERRLPVIESKDYLDFEAIFAITVLTLLWGFNYAAIKYSNQGIAPAFTSTLRSVIASICGIIYCLKKGEKLFHTDLMLFHGFMVGLLFGGEFACIYTGLVYTDAARSVLFVYMSPFVVAVGAHFFLKDDRLTIQKTLGLLLAFSGLVIVFYGKPKSAKTTMYIGDILQILAGIFWGATTVYIKRFMSEKVHPINTYLYQFVFSIPVLFIVSLIFEPKWVYKIDLSVVAAFFYQSIIVASISFFFWFKLIHGYSVIRLSAFTFLTPVFGVLFGILFLGEELTVSLMVALPLVCIGIFLVNWRKKS